MLVNEVSALRREARLSGRDGSRLCELTKASRNPKVEQMVSTMYLESNLADAPHFGVYAAELDDSDPRGVSAAAAFFCCGLVPGCAPRICKHWLFQCTSAGLEPTVEWAIGVMTEKFSLRNIPTRSFVFGLGVTWPNCRHLRTRVT